ncbi:MAG: extensin family protein [Geminicoccaceae bacterium]
MLVSLVGCSGTAERRATPVTQGYPTGAACLAALDELGVRVRPWNAPDQGACAVDTPVQPLGGTSRLLPPPPTSCSMLYAWMAALPQLDQLARQQLGSPIRAVETLGSYSCRRMTGNSRRMSLHASARALDISAFDLADGSRVVVEKEWRSRSPRGQFLRSAAKALCRPFSAVLTPNSDRFHANHIHVDIGRWKLCDV